MFDRWQSKKATLWHVLVHLYVSFPCCTYSSAALKDPICCSSRHEGNADKQKASQNHKPEARCQKPETLSTLIVRIT
ncbi:hypothetical protein B0I72DRAFT_134680 [Yarrowia lipolytica]|nr:hypothetical protein BKA91DRAFT_134777 [Yarrowia lipolytica]KAE8170629.1 hypothetical protein BKA90DRAFT_140481 [Yarrowia lipolytica]RDW34488.1 hypothetical protein B0I72DRAFT_134680 [Yarrowia lipolytica]RDW39396.1 hypothetical protein B0I73DRAFT_132073 [Yarrowia lipolytica]RDW48647.1 hypothetical protein B0I74DRAFT_133053 [Yarrowia lipolytica]